LAAYSDPFPVFAGVDDEGDVHCLLDGEPYSGDALQIPLSEFGGVSSAVSEGVTVAVEDWRAVWVVEGEHVRPFLSIQLDLYCLPG